jgi:glycosidase
MSWLSDAVIYQVFIDRFAGYDPQKDWHLAERMGGNLRGVIDKFEYIKSLGVNTIWLSPFYKAYSYHGYDTTDYYTVDEHLGTEADLKELIDLVHQNGMKIIADFVPNHCSYKHPYFLDAQRDPKSPYRDWFVFTHWPDAYMPFYVFSSMPKINHNNPAALEHVRGAARKWLALGLDGYRVDHAVGLSNQTIDALLGPLKAEFADRVFFGETAMFNTDGEPDSRVTVRAVKTFGIPNRYLVWALGSYGLDRIFRNYMGHFDGVLDFYVLYQLVRMARGVNPKRINRKLQRHVAKYPPNYVLIHFLDNHDQNRYLFRVGGDISKLLLAANMQFSLPGAKVIYYGTEIGMNQEMDFKQAGMLDTQARQPMPWDESRWNHELLQAYKKLVAGETAGESNFDSRRLPQIN